jgi:hypothetical protein
MKAWLIRLGLWLAAAGILLAAPLFDTAVPTLKLKDGTVLQNAQIKGYSTKVVMVKHQDGARTVPYGLFPDEYQAGLAARRPAGQETPASATPLAPAAPGPSGPTGPKPETRNPDLQYGCTFSVLGATGDVVTMEIHNESDQPAAVLPQMFVARTYAGELLPGSQWVGLNEEGRVTTMLKRFQVIPPGETVTLRLMVPPKPRESAIETVLWKR